MLIQLDGGTLQIFADGMDFGLDTRTGQWNIQIETQPAQSQYTNALNWLDDEFLSFLLFCAGWLVYHTVSGIQTIQARKT
jgi:hypothetical protein